MKSTSKFFPEFVEDGEIELTVQDHPPKRRMLELHEASSSKRGPTYRDLPIELKIFIWEYFLREGKVIALGISNPYPYYSDNIHAIGGNFHAANGWPAHTSAPYVDEASRKVASGASERLFPWPSLHERIDVDFSRDIVLLPELVNYQSFAVDIGRDNRKRLRFIAFASPRLEKEGLGSKDTARVEMSDDINVPAWTRHAKEHELILRMFQSLHSGLEVAVMAGPEAKSELSRKCCCKSTIRFKHVQTFYQPILIRLPRSNEDAGLGIARQVIHFHKLYWAAYYVRSCPGQKCRNWRDNANPVIRISQWVRHLGDTIQTWDSKTKEFTSEVIGPQTLERAKSCVEKVARYLGTAANNEREVQGRELLLRSKSDPFFGNLQDTMSGKELTNSEPRGLEEWHCSF